MRAHPAGPRHGEGADLAGQPVVPADLNALDPAVWPQSIGREPIAGALTIGGVDLRDLTREHGSPAYVLDERDFRVRMHSFREAFPDSDVYYAGKAFLCRAVARWVAQEGLNLDVCSGGELAIALSAGLPASRIALHGNNKSIGEISAALDAGVGRIVLDSFEEIVRVAAAAEERGVRARVLVRVTVGVEAHTHEFIATAHEDQKFGFSLAEGDAEEAVRRVLKLKALDLVGLHSHIGSQIFDTAGFEVSAHRVVELAGRIRDEHGVELAELGLGGGFGIAYVAGDDPEPTSDIAARLIAIVGRECTGLGLAVPRLSVEPGRAIAGPGTITVYEVGTVKPVRLDGGLVRTFVSVDGGMSDNIRTALYDSSYSAVLASRRSDAEPMLTRVVGKHCESGDVVVKDCWLPADLASGDLLAVAATGAYCRSMASNYNQLGRPPVVAVRDGLTSVMVRRETIEDLLRLDAG
ncbi:MAG: diaminopimelate decarboxylase [Candidatus Nanopelagicales bacterium]